MNSSSDEPNRTIHRSEVCWVALLTAVAGWFRFAGLGQQGISHFDEGVYVLWGLGAGYPGKEFFAPPLFPLLVCGCSRLLGPSDLAALAVNALFGTATVPLVWWVARRWYGVCAGLVAATWAACSDFHIAFSRMALTDTSFGFWFVLALAAASQVLDGCRKPDQPTESPVLRPRSGGGWLWAILLGLAAGAAMNTKYNGFLVLVFTFAALAAAAAIGRGRGEINWNTALIRLAAASLLAVLLYLPWLMHVSSEVGYGKLLQHQRGYTTGLATWPNNLISMLANQQTLTGWRTRIGMVCSGAITIGLGLRWKRHSWQVATAMVGYLMAVSVVFGDAAGWLLGVFPVAVQPGNRREVGPLHAAWLLGLILLTPFYSPYARLLMPLAPAGWIAAGYALSALSETPMWSRSGRSSVGHWALAVTGWAAAAASVVWCATEVHRSKVPAQEGRGLRWACERLGRSLPETGRVAVFARPPVVFYLFGQGRQPDLLGNLDVLDSAVVQPPRYLVVDSAILRDNPIAAEVLGRASPQLIVREKVPYRVTAPVLLDDWGWSGISAPVPESLFLYEVSQHRPDRLE